MKCPVCRYEVQPTDRECVVCEYELPLLPALPPPSPPPVVAPVVAAPAAAPKAEMKRTKAAARAEPAKSRRDEDEPQVHPAKENRFVLLVPAGHCPVPLTGTDEAVVAAWMKAVRKACPRYILPQSALAYYAREFYPVFTEEHAQVSRILMQLAPE